MDSKKKALSELESLFIAGDAWLMKYGIVSPIAHNNIVTNLYMNFPQVKYLEYFLDTENRKVEVVLYIKFWRLLFTRKDRLISDAINLLKEYLYNYTITVRLKRYTNQVREN